MQNQNKLVENVIWIIIAIGMLVVIQMQVSDAVAVNGIGARFFPRLAAFTVLVPNVFQMVINLVKKDSKQETHNKKTHIFILEKNEKVVISILLALASTFLVKYMGFVLTYCVLCGLLMLVYGVRKLYIYLIVFGIVILTFLLFTRMLYIPLPSLFL